MADAALLKEQLNQQAVRQLAGVLVVAYPAFDQPRFEQQACTGLERLELKARVRHIMAALATSLPAGFCETARILATVADIWPEHDPQRNWSSFSAWPLLDYVSVYGLDYPQRAFHVLEKLTPLFTAEFAIRPFLERHFDLSHQQMLNWTQHDNEHVRRLASEGIRPRLPWAAQLSSLRADPSPLWPILDKLKTDPSLYVRRSVANNLNDISKDHPEQVVAVCRQWQRLSLPQTDWILRHGLRTLVKTGHPEVYPLLGFSDKPALKTVHFTATPRQLEMGDKLEFSLELETKKPERLVVDYRLGFKRADGRLSWKVFKWKNIETQPDTLLKLEKSQQFRPISTRRYYPGTHAIECLINGRVVARAAFELLSG